MNNTKVMSVILSHLAADRRNLEPLNMQLSNAIEQAVFSGQLPEGSALPSVRVLAERIGISPNTVVKSYRKLSEDGWIRSIPKRGYFVTFGSEEAIEISTSTGHNVKDLLNVALSAAREADIPMDVLVRWVREGYHRQPNNRNLVAVVGYVEAFLDQRADVIASAVKGLPYEVIQIPISGYEGALNPSEIIRENVAVYIVPVGQVRRVAEALGSEASRILPMTRRLRDDVRDAIAMQPAWTRFGVVSGSRLTAGRIRAALHRLHPCNVEPKIVLTSAGINAINEINDWADIVVIGTTARADLRAHGYPSKPSIEMAYLPDDYTLRQLRLRLEAMAPGLQAGSTDIDSADANVALSIDQ